MEPFLGQVSIFACNFAPSGWALCEGQLLPIAQYTALFSLLGVNFGGNGVNIFGLPDLRGRAPLGIGQGLGLSPYAIGEVGGEESVTISSTTYPAHSHALNAAAGAAGSNAPAGAVEAGGQTGGRGGTVNLALYSASGAATPLAPAALSTAAGGGGPHNNRQPYLGLNFCIALRGIFPPRS
jgi:microcystin-dependent protein